MCLTRIDTLYDKPSDLIVSGWKEFGGTTPQPKFMNFGTVVKLDEWIAAGDIKVPMDIKASDGKLYKAGFHVYDGEYPSLRRVYLRRITCVGDQDGKRCVIAQEMYVPSNESGWPPQPLASPTPAPKKKLSERFKKK